MILPPEIQHKKRTFVFVAALYALMVALSVYCLVLKRDSLQFHPRDYNYFIEQAARLADPRLTDMFTLNIDGYNFLGRQGTEGVDRIYQAIHAEYFRYTYLALYWLFHDTLPIYIFYSMIYFLPLLYFAAIRKTQPGGSWQPVVLFALLFALVPATIPSITFDLRSRMLFASAWTLSALAVYCERPFVEKLVFFGFLLCLREEGILLGAVILVMNFVRMAGKSGRWKQTLLFLGVDGLALALFLRYMAWGGFTRVDSMFDPRNSVAKLLEGSGLVATIVAAVALLAVVAFLWRSKHPRFKDFMLLLVYSAAVILTGFQALRDLMSWNSIQTSPLTDLNLLFKALIWEKTSLVFYVALLPLVLLWDYTRTNGRGRAWLRSGLVLLCVIFTAITLLILPPKIVAWKQEVRPAELVWQFKRGMDRYTTNVLLDYNTYQAFYDCENILVYNRLPIGLANLNNRFYPQNKPILVQEIRSRMEYAVIGRESLAAVLELAKLAGVPAVEIASNERFVILAFRVRGN